MRLRCDLTLDSLNVVQEADEAPKVEDGAKIFVTVGVKAPLGAKPLMAIS